MLPKPGKLCGAGGAGLFQLDPLHRIGAASLLIADFAACSGYCIHLLVHSCKKPLHILRRVQMLPTHQRYLGGEAIQPAASLPALRRQGLPILLFVQRRNAQHDCHTAEEAQISGDTGQMQIEIPLPVIFFRRRIFPGIFPCVSHLESINLNKTDLDVKGVAFEQFMDGFFKGDFGQYFTPRPIIEFAVKMMKPEHDWDVLDPACGSGGFLLHALDYMRSQASEYYDKDTVDYFNYWHDFASKHLYGIEINDEIARVAKMNMIVHDDGHTNVISFDALDSIDKMHDHNRGFEAGKFDLILTNPPFGSTITKAEKPYLANYELGKTKDAKGKYKDRPRQSSEILFIERIWEFLKPGTGKAAIVLPDGVLTNSSAQYVRDFILEKFQLLAVVSLPQCAFAHFGAGVKTSIIFVRKRKADEKPDENEAIFMAAPALIGYDATGRKTDSQLDEIIQKYEEFQKDATPFFA